MGYKSRHNSSLTQIFQQKIYTLISFLNSYCFSQIYMMPESSSKGELRLYRALKFPLQWTLYKVIMKKPLVDAFIINYDGKYWLFGSDHSGFGASKNGQLEIWYGSSPLGPWKPHKNNPIYNVEKSFGARNGGRPFFYNGNLYRIGQDCGETYGKGVRIFKVEVLTDDEYKEVEVPLGLIGLIKAAILGMVLAIIILMCSS